MSEPVLIAPVPVAADSVSAERVRLAADFDLRWAAWQTRGRMHDRLVRRRLLIAAPVVAVAAAIAYFLLIR